MTLDLRGFCLIFDCVCLCFAGDLDLVDLGLHRGPLHHDLPPVHGRTLLQREACPHRDRRPSRHRLHLQRTQVLRVRDGVYPPAAQERDENRLRPDPVRPQSYIQGVVSLVVLHHARLRDSLHHAGGVELVSDARRPTVTPTGEGKSTPPRRNVTTRPSC